MITPSDASIRRRMYALCADVLPYLDIEPYEREQMQIVVRQLKKEAVFYARMANRREKKRNKHNEQPTEI